jgi:two-component system cell cycle response regulator
MKTEKYKQLILQRILQTIDEWSELASVEEQVIHRFFHNLKGTSGTIGLLEVEKFSETKEQLFSEKSSKAISREKWLEHLQPITDLFPHLSQRLEGVENDALVAADNIGGQSVYRDRVLVIDDDVDFVTYVKEALEKQNYPVSIALDAERGLKLFYEWKPSLILLDIVLPDKSGMYVLNQIVGKAKQEHIPIIMISGNFSLENQIHAYRTGAMDFLAKPFDIDLLTALIDNRFAMKKDWERSIIIDELTGAYNRKHFNQMMRHYIESFNREREIFTLVMLDLDYFKQVNDTYGHLKGDEVLQAFVATVQAAIRPQDIFCRYGGEEFALILPCTDAATGAIVVDHVRMKFNAVKFQVEDDCFQITFSAGVSEITNQNSHTELLIEEADQALYNGKRGGRNQTVVYSQELIDAKLEAFLNVIIVDDDALIREIVINRFSGWKPANHAKVQAFEYADGLSFLTSDWFKEGEKYIILLDGSMPDLDGLDVLYRLRNNYPEQQMLIIMLTARNNKADIVQALQIGADDYVVKPFHMQELVLRIERLANRILS